MKKNLFMALLVLSSINAKVVASADAFDYPFLIFQTADGAKTSIAVGSLTMTVSDGLLDVRNGETDMTLVLANLSKMYFSSVPTGISAVLADKVSEGVEVYSLLGMPVGRFDSISQARTALARGIYVIKTNEGTQKIAIQ